MSQVQDPKQLQELIFRGASEIIVAKDLKSRLTTEKLRVKFGIDPTGDKIHIGHASVIRKLKYFQALGHQVVLIVGDFTGRIGDPSDKQSERNVLTTEEIAKNLKTYEQQLAKIFAIDQAEVRYNSEWFERLGLDEFLRLQGLFSVAQMLERENFKLRWDKQQRIGLQEFMYPLLQGYDSVAVKAGVELGGNDQLFNLTAGRTLQKQYGQAPQNLVTYELLLGPDGRKMSKSWGNCIWIDDAPLEMYGKVMSVNDELMSSYFHLVTEVPATELKTIDRQLAAHQDLRALKARLAREVTALHHDAEAAEAAEAEWQRQFQAGELPQEIPAVRLAKAEWELAELLVEAGLAASKSSARRLVGQGGVKLNQKAVSQDKINVKDDDILQVGKRKFRRLKL